MASIFFSVGEPSGDLHGANLIRAMRERRPDVAIRGFGGPRMTEAGGEFLFDLTQLAIMGFSRVLGSVHRFAGLLRQADRYLSEHRPDLVVLIDYPGFNWWVARRARAHGIPVVYYGTPQMWAWAGWRVRKMRRLVDHVLCKLAFETDWYRERGVNAEFVGHPYFDELSQYVFDEEFLAAQASRPEPLVTILPGSRTQEVANNLETFLRAAQRIHDRLPTVRFAIASFNDKQAGLAQTTLSRLGLAHRLPIEVHVGRTPELIRASRSCLACSGSVSLELLYHGKPSVILYRTHVTRPQLWLARKLLTVRYITLPNLIACEDRFDVSSRYDPDGPAGDFVPFPEYLTIEDRSAEIAQKIVGWLSDPAVYAERVAWLERLKQEHAHGGASKTAADHLVRLLPALQAASRAA